MRLLPSTRSLATGGSALALALSLSFPAYAQVVEESDPPAQLEGEVEVESGQDADQSETGIVVTGTRIRRPNLESNQPITSVGIQELTDTGDVSIGDALNDLPSIRSTYSQGNSTRFIGTSGLNVLDLRGLGTARTLVLVNGRRHVTALPGENWVDVNMIPTDLIERVDVVTGGNSAIYGSDAVAGVVNFVLRRDYEGIRLRGQGGVSEEGDRGTYFVSAIAGTNFGDGRGNVAVNLEYATQNELMFIDRDELTGAFRGRCQFNLAEPTAGEPSTGDGVPDNQFFCGVRNFTISDYGTIGLLSNTQALRFDEAGNLFVDNCPHSFVPFGSGNCVGGQGSTLRNTGMLAPQLDRYSANLLARYEISPALVPFIEATYVRVEANQEGQPSFFQGSFQGFFGFFDPANRPSNLRCDNPYLNAQSLATLQSYGICTNPATGTFNMARFNVDFGGRGEEHVRQTYRLVGGIEGDFNGDWRYELAVNYGRFESEMRSINNLYLFDMNGNPAGFLLAADAARDPATGQIVCRVNIDANPANDDPNCVPINVFGASNLTAAQSDYIHTDAQRNEWAEQFVVSGFVSGDSSQLFSLPGGPVGFALGAEYRREDSYSAWDELTAFGGTFMNAIQPFEPPALEVREAFGEIRLPLLRDLPFARELTVELAGRVSDYNNRVGTVYAYNIGGTYAPVNDFRVRANYSTSVRAPTQGDLYSPLSQNFAFVQDPCDILYRGTNPYFDQNCDAAGIPDGFVNNIARTQTIEYRSGGNELLTEERGRSWTVGAVFTPNFLPGFSFTVDYYNIEVENLIATLGPQTILNLCYGNQGGINNQYCDLIQREPDGTITPGFPISGGVNYAAQETEGIDFEVAYRRTFDNGHRLNFRTIVTHVLDLNNYTDPVNPDNPNRQLGELGDPLWAFNASLNYDFGALDIGYTLRYLGKQTISTWEAQHPFNGNPPANPDVTREVYYPAVWYHNIRIGYEVTENFAFYAGVDNLTDLEPPFGLLGTAGGDPYDTYGRFFYAGARVDF